MGKWTRVHKISEFDIDAAQEHCTATVHSTLRGRESTSGQLEDLCKYKEISDSGQSVPKLELTCRNLWSVHGLFIL